MKIKKSLMRQRIGFNKWKSDNFFKKTVDNVHNLVDNLGNSMKSLF